MFDKSKVLKKYNLAVDKMTLADSQAGSRFSGSSKGVVSMIGADVKIEGSIVSEESLLIEGVVNGSITAKQAEIRVGKSGTLTADIAAKIVRIEGIVKGDICGGEKVIIASTGNVLGNIDSPRVSLEDGAKFKGSITMDPDEKTVTDLPVGSKPTVKSHRAGHQADAQAS